MSPLRPREEDGWRVDVEAGKREPRLDAKLLVGAPKKKPSNPLRLPGL